MRINNHSYQAVTVNKLYANIGKKDDDIFFSMNDLVDIVSYVDYTKTIKLKNVNELPCYLLPNESKNITIILGIMETDRVQFIANGASLSFRTSTKSYNTQIKWGNIIEIE